MDNLDIVKRVVPSWNKMKFGEVSVSFQLRTSHVER